MSFHYITAQQTIGNRLSDQTPPDWDIAIICFIDFKSSMKLVETFDATPIRYKVFYGMDALTDPPYVYEAKIGDRKIGILTKCLWGGPQAAILVEELSALGVRTIIGYGAAGSIASNLYKYTPIVAQSALATDGTSRMYEPEHNVLEVDPVLMQIAVQATDNSPDLLHPVRIATVDALFRETDDIINEWVDMGAQAVNMESGTLYTVSASCGVNSIWIGFVSDSLVDKVWDGWTEENPTVIPNYARICWKVVSAIVAH